MNFPSVRQIVGLVILVVAFCYVFDYYKNPQLWHHEAPAMASGEKGPHLTLWINHLCCSDCLKDAREALAALPGIDAAAAKVPKQLLTREEADKNTATLPDYGNSIELPVSDVDKLDLVQVDKALRDKGLVAGRIELEGVEHFRLAAQVEHLCCGMCARSTPERFAFLRARGQSGTLKWLDSVSVDAAKKTIIAHARYLEAGKSVEVSEFLSALNDIGYAPRSVQVLAHEEGHAANTQAGHGDRSPVPAAAGARD